MITQQDEVVLADDVGMVPSKNNNGLSLVPVPSQPRSR
jgi:hypothetical protein